MSVFDRFRSQNSIEHVSEPELALTTAPGGFPPAGPAPGASRAMPVFGPAIATAPASGARTDPPGIQAQYYIENAGKERRYYKDLEGKQFAFRADSKAVTTRQEDRATVSHMLDVAQARGWTSLHVRGTATFKQEVWIEAQARDLAVKGYEPTADDRRSVQARRVAREKTAEAEPSATVQPPQENIITNTAQPQQRRTQTAQPSQPAALMPAPASATPAAARQVVNGPVKSQAEEASQRPDEAVGKAQAAEPGVDAGQPVESTGEAGRKAPAKAGDKSTQQQQFPRHAREPWMEETGGYAALSPAQQGSAERSHERWTAAGTPERPHTMDLEEYVGHVQGKQAEAREKETGLEAKVRNGKRKGETEATPAPSAPAAKSTAETGTAEAVQLSPNARKVLAFLEQRIETQMAKLTDDAKADLRAHAAQAIAKRESEVGPVKLPTVKADRKQQAGRDQAATKVSGGEQKPAQVQQPRMGMG